MCLQSTDNEFDLTIKYYMLEKFEIFVKEAKFPEICKYVRYYNIFLNICCVHCGLYYMRRNNLRVNNNSPPSFPHGFLEQIPKLSYQRKKIKKKTCYLIQ